MTKRIGMVGVPIEDVYVCGQMTELFRTYIPRQTDELRAKIIEGAAIEGVNITDLGEICLGEYYEPAFPTDRYEEVSDRQRDLIRGFELARLERERLSVLANKSDYELLISVGHSHLGGIVLYEDNDKVARLDYHGDYYSGNYNIMLNFATYMNWVEKNISQAEVHNYFARDMKYGKLQPVYGTRVSGESISGKLVSETHVSGLVDRTDDRSYLSANHFDIDVDCVDWKYHIQDSYSQDAEFGGHTGVSPDDIVRMVGEAKPDKIGFWEYRLNHDRSRWLGLKMIVDSIVAAAR